MLRSPIQCHYACFLLFPQTILLLATLVSNYYTHTISPCTTLFGVSSSASRASLPTPLSLISRSAGTWGSMHRAAFPKVDPSIITPFPSPSYCFVTIVDPQPFLCAAPVITTFVQFKQVQTVPWGTTQQALTVSILHLTSWCAPVYLFSNTFSVTDVPHGTSRVCGCFSKARPWLTL